MLTAIITSEGLTTIPKEIRELVGLQAGDAPEVAATLTHHELTAPCRSRDSKLCVFSLFERPKA